MRFSFMLLTKTILTPPDEWDNAGVNRSNTKFYEASIPSFGSSVHAAG